MSYIGLSKGWRASTCFELGMELTLQSLWANNKSKIYLTLDVFVAIEDNLCQLSRNRMSNRIAWTYPIGSGTEGARW